jgi:hypothetical protein
MQTESPIIQSLNDLRQFVYQTLCDQNDLEIGAFDITERFLVRSGVPCGMYFCLHGPRSVRLTAIWAAVENTVRFYGSTGERLLKTQLQAAVKLELAVA